MIDIKEKLNKLNFRSKSNLAATTILGTEGVLAGKHGHDLAKSAANEFNHNYDGYDEAVDYIYNDTHVGGSTYHHIVDGNHSILGAYNSVKDVSPDDSTLTELAQSTEHLLRDLASVSGISPFFSLTPEQFDKFSDLFATFGISKKYVADAITINAPELIGGVIALIGSIYYKKKGDSERLSYIAGGTLLASIISGNPLGVPIAVGSLIYSIKDESDKKAKIIKAGKGAVVSGTALVVSSAVGGPLVIGLASGIVTSIVVSKVVENPNKFYEYGLRIVKPVKEIGERIQDRIDDKVYKTLII